MPSFIADGYEFHAGINPIEKVHDGIEFYYRPLTPSEKAEFLHEMNKSEGAAAATLIARWLTKKILRWQSRKGADGKRSQLPTLTEKLLSVGDNGMTINNLLLMSLVNVVIWGEPPDYSTEESFEDAEKN